MTSYDDDRLPPIQLVETQQAYTKKPKIRYTRKILLSFSGLDICKKLPSGFDPSVLSEFEDASSSLPERPIIPGSLSAQNFRRGEYGTSPPTRGDSGSYSRGIQGRWDTRSSGSNDKDSDLQLDLESDSGRRYVGRRSWQNPEQQDGLLGSGSFPKPAGITNSTSVAKGRGNGQYQLSRSNEPYHPPRPYKAAPHSRRDEMINEETFGSSESSSQDRVEEERQRRASFEQFRKEAKATQEQQKQFPDKHNENVDPDIAALLANSEDDKKLWDKNIGLNHKPPNILQGDSVKTSFVAQTSASRPRVPPGFKGVTQEKNLGTQSSISQSTLKVGNGRGGETVPQIEGNCMANVTSNNQADVKSVSQVDTSEKLYGTKTGHTPPADFSEKSVILSSGGTYEISIPVISPSYKNPNHSEGLGDQRNNEGTNFNAEKVPGASQENSTSILAKLFGKASVVDSGGSRFSEPGDVNADMGIPVPFESSKFTHWFHEEEKRPEEDLSSAKPEDLLSLIVNGDKHGSQMSPVSDDKPPIFTLGSNDLMHKSMTTTSCSIATVDPPHQSNNSGGSQVVLTCEDLEQSILSEFSDNSSNVDHSFQAWNALDAKAEKRPEVDNHASQHLLSLLQMGTSAQDLAQSPIHEVSKNPSSYEADSTNIVSNVNVGNAEKVTKSERNLTLETLFGTAFMEELQSFKAPVSVQRGSVGGVTHTDVLESQQFPFSVPDTLSSRLERDTPFSNQLQQSKSIRNEEAWLGFDASQSKLGSNRGSVGVINRPDEALDIQLPDEESLLTISDPMVSQHSMVGDARQAELSSSSSMPVDIVDKLAALNAVLKKERSTIPGYDHAPFLRGASDYVEPGPFQNQHERPMSQFAHLQMNHGRPMFRSSDSHPSHMTMSPPLKAMGPENVHPEFSQHHFPANMIHPSSFQHAPNGPTRFSPPAHHPMLQQMHMQGNRHPAHLQRGLPRGVQMPPYPMNHMSGYTPEPNPMQNLPYGHHQPNYSGLELPMQAHAAGSGGNNHPEAFEKLIEMERRANLKQMHPVPGAAHNLGNHHGIDMGFRYR